MRGIKFTFWVKALSEIHPVRALHAYYDGGFSVQSDINGNWYGPETIELLQYTGLKDRNGKEIYEGDIVKWTCHPFEKTGEVRFSEGYYDLWDDRKSVPFLCCDWSRGEAKIIGNIHQHPELLK